jgi:hypothetical protein
LWKSKIVTLEIKDKKDRKTCKAISKCIRCGMGDDMVRNLYPFNNFPNDCCGHTCDLLSQYLLEHGIETRQVNGTCRKNSEWHYVWLKTENKTVIDIPEINL